MSGGGGSSNTTVKENADPWKPMQPYLEFGFGESKDLYEQGGPQFYPGQTYIDPNNLQTLSQAQMLGYSQNQMPQLFGNLASGTSNLLNATNVANNPYVGAMADTIQGRLAENLTENIMPSIGRGAVAAGQYGGSRQGIMEGKAIEGTQEATGDALAALYSDAYGQGLDAQSKGALAMPSVMAAGMMPAQTLGGVGSWIQGQNQMALDEDMSRWAYNQNLPMQNLQNYIANIQGIPVGMAGSSTAKTSGGGQSALGGAVGGGLLGLSAMQGLAGMTGGAVPGLAGMGAMGAYLPWIGIPALIGSGLFS